MPSKGPTADIQQQLTAVTSDRDRLQGLIDSTIEALEDRYDGAPDSSTRWLGEILSRLSGTGPAYPVNTSVEDVRQQLATMRMERDRVKNIEKVSHLIQALVKEVVGWGMQTEYEELDLTTAEFSETWRMAQKIQAVLTEAYGVKKCVTAGPTKPS